MFLYQSAKFLSEKPFTASFIMFSVCKKSIILYRMPSCRYQNGIFFLQTSWNTPQMPQASRAFVVKVARRAVHDKNKCESVSGNAVLAFRNRVVLRTLLFRQAMRAFGVIRTRIVATSSRFHDAHRALCGFSTLFYGWLSIFCQLIEASRRFAYL